MKTRKNFTLSDQAIEALSYLETQTHQSSSSIVEDLILTAAAGGNIPEQTLQLFDKRYSNWQKGLLLSSRQTERYCFQMIEMLNSMFLNLFDKDQEQFFPTHRYELEIDRANGNYDPHRYDNLVSPTYRKSAEETKLFYSKMKERKDNAK